jgi:hypothetical protein
MSRFEQTVLSRAAMKSQRRTLRLLAINPRRDETDTAGLPPFASPRSSALRRSVPAEHSQSLDWRGACNISILNIVDMSQSMYRPLAASLQGMPERDSTRFGLVHGLALNFVDDPTAFDNSDENTLTSI